VRDRASDCLRAFLLSTQVFRGAEDEVDILLSHVPAFPECFSFVDQVLCKASVVCIVQLLLTHCSAR
jgi:uncharacterized protein involved in cysteine biosynthesis